MSAPSSPTMKAPRRRLIANPIDAAAVLVLAGMALVAICAPMFVADPNNMNFGVAGVSLQPPSGQFWLGTDPLGRDILGQLIWGGRVSLTTALVASISSALIGSLIGAVAGFVGGKVDLLLMRFVDASLMIPRFFLILLIVAIFGPSIVNVIVAIALTTWPETARLLRAEVLSQKQRDYVRSARVAGAGPFRILFGEIMPNCLHPVIVKASLLTGSAILTEASLGFLGLTDPTLITWGRMVKEALPVFNYAPWTLLAPGAVISITIAAFNILGDAINNRFNPKGH
jgi:ABC-type dipeptide/oligopeptide/nickel transport systems, permease components